MIDAVTEQYQDVEKYGYLLTPYTTYSPAMGSEDSRIPASWKFTGSIINRAT